MCELCDNCRPGGHAYCTSSNSRPATRGCSNLPIFAGRSRSHPCNRSCVVSQLRSGPGTYHAREYLRTVTARTPCRSTEAR
eukprot:1253011-Rhodomonas_salina.2